MAAIVDPEADIGRALLALRSGGCRVALAALQMSHQARLPFGRRYGRGRRSRSGLAGCGAVGLFRPDLRFLRCLRCLRGRLAHDLLDRLLPLDRRRWPADRKGNLDILEDWKGTRLNSN